MVSSVGVSRTCNLNRKAIAWFRAALSIWHVPQGEPALQSLSLFEEGDRDSGRGFPMNDVQESASCWSIRS